MKKLTITILFLLGFAGTALFGFAMMSHSDEKMTDCVASKITTSECPASGLAMVLHHVSAYQSFTTAVTAELIGISLMALIFFAIIGFSYWRKFTPPRHIIRHYRWRSLYDFVSTQLQTITGWLSLLENSPAYPRQRA